jgi:CheY-like chemotaxis protein
MPLEKMLQMSGHRVHTASSGSEGLETARAIRPSVVLCDIGLGNGMTGYDVARAMRRHPELAGVYLVAVTGYGQEDDRQRAQAAGFDYHLTKPVSKQELDVVVSHMPRF